MTDREAYIVLNMINGIGPARAGALVAFCGSPSAVLDAKEDDLASVQGISRQLAERVSSWRKHVDLDSELAAAEAGGAEITTLADDAYPDILKTIRDAPMCLYVRGKIAKDLSSRSIAMVGTRNASHYGVTMARHLAEAAAFSSWTVVSGLAIGIDTIAHRATVDAGGKTIAVLGGGLAHLHPQENLMLARDIVSSGGAVVSEFPMATAPTRHTFPLRNRIISGLAMGTIVVEAGMNSGSLITASNALEQGRRVFAVPGQADNRNASGCNSLIRQGAVLTETFDHVLEEFDFLPGFDRSVLSDGLDVLHEPSGMKECTTDSPLFNDEAMSALDLAILDVLQHDGDLTPDRISEKTSASPGDVISALIALEILHRVKKLPNGSYRRVR